MGYQRPPSPRHTTVILRETDKTQERCSERGAGSKPIKSQSDKMTTAFVPLTKTRQQQQSAAVLQRTIPKRKRADPSQAAFQYPLACMLPIRKNCLCRGEKAHMANPVAREECGNTGWVAAVTELSEKCSLLPGKHEPLLSSSACRKTYCLHCRYDSYEKAELLKA